MEKFEDILNQLSEKDRESLFEDYHEEYLRHKKTIENIYNKYFTKGGTIE